MKKTLLPALLVAGIAVASLTGCVTTTKEVVTSTPTAPSTSAAEDNMDFYGALPKDIPVIPTSDITSADTNGSDVTGDYTVNVKTKGTTAKEDAAKVLTDAAFTSSATDVYENTKWKITLSGSGSSVTYKIDRK